MKRGGFLKRKTGLKKKGKSATATLKDSIQAKLRERVIERDGGCVLRNHPQAGKCGGFSKGGVLILQAEHLNGRRHSNSYAELDNIVCLCWYHHIFFKKQEPALYWVLIRERIGLKRWLKVEAWIKDKKPYRMGKKEWEGALAKL